MTDRVEALARLHHETYERLAPEYGYKTRDATAVPWDEVPENNKELMLAVARAAIEFMDKEEGAISKTELLKWLAEHDEGIVVSQHLLKDALEAGDFDIRGSVEGVTVWVARDSGELDDTWLEVHETCPEKIGDKDNPLIVYACPQTDFRETLFPSVVPGECRKFTIRVEEKE